MTAGLAGPKRRPDLLFDEAGAELVVFDPATDLAHVLNETAAAIFLLCDGRSLNSIVRELARIPGAEAADIPGDVARLVASFEEKGLLLPG